MATIALGPMGVKGTVSGNAPQVIKIPEAATQTYKVGAVLVMNTSGYAEIGASDATNILGVAFQAGANDAAAGDSDALVYVANADTIFLANMSGAVSAITDVGVTYGLVLTGTSFHVDKSDTTNRRCLVLDLDSRDAVGDTNHRVHFQFHPLHRRLAYTS